MTKNIKNSARNFRRKRLFSLRESRYIYATSRTMRDASTGVRYMPSEPTSNDISDIAVECRYTRIYIESCLGEH